MPETRAALQQSESARRLGEERLRVALAGTASHASIAALAMAVLTVDAAWPRWVVVGRVALFAAVVVLLFLIRRFVVFVVVIGNPWWKADY